MLSSYQNGSDSAFQYTYDANGNITHIQQGTTHIYYQYDALNQLVREDNSVLNKSITYTYDDRGNLQTKKEYAYVANGGTLGSATATITYGYDSAYQGWADQLTSYNGQAIRYDASGNPTTYRGYTMTWNGRQLVTASNGTNTVSYSYDENGIRTQKTVNGTKTSYNYHGSVLISQVTGSNTLLFSYDASGDVAAVNYNGTYYYYVRNGQGDIVKLIDGNNATVVEYSYDSWGKLLSTTGTLASTLGAQNPFRYRGYVYDTETGLYYLQSRYYDPEVGRFINADIYMSTGQGLLGNNMYAYCLNNPILYIDSNGNKAEIAAEDNRYRFVGIGFQGELNVGSYEVGFEIIVYYDDLVCGGKEPLVSVYLYEGAFINGEDIMKNTKYMQTVEKLTLAITTNAIDEQNIEALLIALQAALFKDVGVSGSVVGIFGNEEFRSTESYAGPFNTYSATINHVKASLSTCVSCFAIAFGGSTERFGASFGQSYYTQIY